MKNKIAWSHDPGAILREELLPGYQFLRNHSGDGNHCETPIVQLLRLQSNELILILRLETKRVESQVSWQMVLLDGPLLILHQFFACAPRLCKREHREDLGDCQGGDHCPPEGLPH